jgi:hypothetical protein
MSSLACPGRHGSPHGTKGTSTSPGVVLAHRTRNEAVMTFLADLRGEGVTKAP